MAGYECAGCLVNESAVRYPNLDRPDDLSSRICRFSYQKYLQCLRTCSIYENAGELSPPLRIIVQDSAIGLLVFIGVICFNKRIIYAHIVVPYTPYIGTSGKWHYKGVDAQLEKYNANLGSTSELPTTSLTSPQQVQRDSVDSQLPNSVPMRMQHPRFAMALRISGSLGSSRSSV
ncbi:hypothetical protein K469DRAFT_354959 [Zopfia rhizophila CBS 207.26]|uniref:Uncharacterized protein n=1 Tax=Zopfia rhizophila CBS 207.26 TaxID=1314779 RepID=A0A6A6DE07_9PEZI|nr:hypothetical protein K469DRAFT_354959 [Zopfia rhizophila CBS 207.26]